LGRHRRKPAFTYSRAFSSLRTAPKILGRKERLMGTSAMHIDNVGFDTHLFQHFIKRRCIFEYITRKPNIFSSWKLHFHFERVFKQFCVMFVQIWKLGFESTLIHHITWFID